jgi:hypothetical protein
LNRFIGESMARRDLGSTTGVTPVLGEDGVVYFHYVPIPIAEHHRRITERVCQYTLVSLWLLAAVWAVGALFWF